MPGVRYETQHAQALERGRPSLAALSQGMESINEYRVTGGPEVVLGQATAVSRQQRTTLAGLVVAALLLVCATVTTDNLRSNAARAAHNLHAHNAASASTVKTYDSQGRVVR